MASEARRPVSPLSLPWPQFFDTLRYGNPRHDNKICACDGVHPIPGGSASPVTVRIGGYFTLRAREVATNTGGAYAGQQHGSLFGTNSLKDADGMGMFKALVSIRLLFRWAVWRAGVVDFGGVIAVHGLRIGGQLNLNRAKDGVLSSEAGKIGGRCGADTLHSFGF